MSRTLPPVSDLDRRNDHEEHEEQRRILDNGFTDTVTPSFVRALVGRNCLTWSVFSNTGAISGETVATFYARIYLLLIGEVWQPPNEIVVPPEWDCGLGAPREAWSPLDTLDALAAIAARWRGTTGLTEAHWLYVRALEHRAWMQMDEPWGAKGLDDFHLLLVHLWGMEYVWRLFDLGTAREDPTPVPADCVGWQAREQADSRKANLEEDIAAVAMVADLAPGETDLYAREHLGVKAQNIDNIFDFTRTHVQARGLKRRAEHFDMRVGAGFVLGALVDRRIYSHLRMVWADQAVVFDIDLPRARFLEKLELRSFPVILLHAGVWYILHRGKPAARCRDIAHAVVLWFVRMRDDHGKIYRHKTTKWDLSLLFRDERFPFAREEE